MSLTEDSSEIREFLTFGEIQGYSNGSAEYPVYLASKETGHSNWMSSVPSIEGKLSVFDSSFDDSALQFNSSEVLGGIPGIYIDKPPSPEPAQLQRSSTSSNSSISSEELLGVGYSADFTRRRSLSNANWSSFGGRSLSLQPVHQRRNSIAVPSAFPLTQPAFEPSSISRPLQFVMENPAVPKEFTAAEPGATAARRHSIACSPSHLYCCPWSGCGKIFNRFYNLRSHYRIHSGERPFSCDVCDASFARNHDLKRHARTHSEIRAFVCHMCGKNFSRNDAMTRHIRLNSCTKVPNFSFISEDFPSS